LAAELNLTVTSGGQSAIVVGPGASVPWEITGELSTGGSDNQGLNFWIASLSIEPAGGSLSPADVPVSAPLLSFVSPHGFANPDGYGGTLVDGVLKQIGGGQNTLKSSLMLGPVVTGVGHTPIVLASGTLTAPTAGGLYTLKASEVLGRVIQDGDDGSGPTWLTEWAFEGTVQGLQMIVTGSCGAFGSCADVDQNGIRDDNCLWWSCDRGSCQATPIVFADMGGQFGSCAPDGAVDANDKFHALNCFSNQTTSGGFGYPCEAAPPVALNVDAGGPFGDCSPDGVCDGNDAFHALNAFDGTTMCSCAPGGPEPTLVRVIRPQDIVKTALTLRPRQRLVKPGELVHVDVFLESALPDLRGYQLHLCVPDDGRDETLDLVDIAVEGGEEWVFAGRGAWTAFNVGTGQMMVGLDTAGVVAAAGAYLATFMYRLPREASGGFVIELLHQSDDGRSFLFPTPADGRIAISAAEHARIYAASSDRAERRVQR
jgi:hypothetical protein